MTRMTNDDLKKNILKYRSEQDMRKALSDLIHQRHTLHVPPDSEDADMVLSDVIEELLEARKKLALLEPLRNAWFSENAWEEALQDPGKALDAMIRPLNLVETPIRNAIKASAMTTREAAEKAANAELEPYMSLPASSFLHQIPVISTKDIDFEALSKEIKSGKPLLVMGSPDMSLQDIEKLREDALHLIDSGDCHGSENLEVLQGPEKSRPPTLVKHFPQIPPIYWKEGEQEL